jgi:hypothetical protein
LTISAKRRKFLKMQLNNNKIWNNANSNPRRLHSTVMPGISLSPPCTKEAIIPPCAASPSAMPYNPLPRSGFSIVAKPSTPPNTPLPRSGSSIVEIHHHHKTPNSPSGINTPKNAQTNQLVKPLRGMCDGLRSFFLQYLMPYGQIPINTHGFNDGNIHTNHDLPRSGFSIVAKPSTPPNTPLPRSGSSIVEGNTHPNHDLPRSGLCILKACGHHRTSNSPSGINKSIKL